MSDSKLENLLAFHIRTANLPPVEREFRFDRTRKYRWDFAWPDYRLAAEVNGGTWRKGAHSSGTGIQRDYDKSNLGVLQGWRIFMFTGKDITSGKAISLLEEALGQQSLQRYLYE